MTGATFLFIQGAESGSVSEVNATTSTLELTDVSDKTILFSDRPDRIVASIDTADFIGNWSTGANSFAVDPPNAALVVDDDVEQRHDLALIELFNPEYDSEANTLKYDIVAENGTSIGGLPGEFGQSTLVIDDEVIILTNYSDEPSVFQLHPDDFPSCSLWLLFPSEFPISHVGIKIIHRSSLGSI